jgi:hypothetical protein
MMTAEEREAILEGTKAARRLHAQLGTRKAVEEGVLSHIDVVSAANQLGATVLFRRLKGLLGAYLAKPVSPVPGIMVSTERDLHVQRFTVAHEIGHLYLKHTPTVDEDMGLWRSASKDPQELAADAFASEFLLPEWLYRYHARRHGWNSAALQGPANTYQLSLRLGASYDAVCWGLQSHDILKPAIVAKLRAIEPKEIKLQTLAGRVSLDNSWANVWVVTEADDGLTFEGTPDDIVIFRFPERASAGYLWDETQLREQGFDVLADARDEQIGDDCGSDVTRVLISRVREPRQYRVSLFERRPWVPSDNAASVTVGFEMFGKEEGLPRHLRKAFAAA